MSCRVAGLILSAGASRRMGSPKALLVLGDELFIDRLIGSVSPSCEPTVVVVGAHAAQIRAGARLGGRVVWVENPDPERGMLSSLQCGLAVLRDQCDAVVFTPVDYPRIQSSTVVALVREWRATRSPVVQPVYANRRGHPVLIARNVIDEILAAPREAQARDVIQQFHAETRSVLVDDDGILTDVDDPDSYRALVETAP